MRSILFLGLILILSGPAFADLARTVALEESLEARISKSVTAVDPEARVSVRVQLKDIKVQLPGVNVDYLGPTSVNQIVAEDVAAIKVRVVSTLDPFPEWLKAELQTGFTFGSAKTEFEFSTLSPEALELVRRQNVITKTVDQLMSYSGRLWPVALIVGGILFAVLMTTFSLMVLWLSSFWRGQVSRLAQALEAGSQGPTGAAMVEREREEPSALFKGSDDGIDLPELGLVELLADCYWSEADGYARWIWDQLKSKQRESVLQKWPTMAEYAEHVRGFEARPRGDHAHPYYFKPLALKSCSQKDLAQFLTKHPEAWHALPPLRRARLDLPLKSRVAMVKAPTKTIGDLAFDKIKSTPRLLAAHQSFGHVSVNDEKEIWSNPNLIPVDLRASVPTLVWAAMLNEEARRELLAGYSANELAQCWLGPDEVLSALRQVIPEKKMKLIESYVAGRAPSRDSDLFAKLAAEAAKRLSASSDKGHGSKAA